jgi:hypothetical protein
MRARTWPYQVPNGGSLGELGSEALSLNANPLFAWLTSSPWGLLRERDLASKACGGHVNAVRPHTRWLPPSSSRSIRAGPHCVAASNRASGHASISGQALTN